MLEMQKGLVEQEFCACGDQNIEPVILMSTDFFLHFVLNFSSLIIVSNFLNTLLISTIFHFSHMSCMTNSLLRTIN